MRIFTDYPRRIVDIIEQECIYQGSKFNPRCNTVVGRDEGGFTWSNAITKNEFWYRILCESDDNERSLEERVKYFDENIDYSKYPGYNKPIADTEGVVRYIVDKDNVKYEVTFKVVENDS